MSDRMPRKPKAPAASPPKSLGDFLSAAPDEVIANVREKAKLVERKAQDDARRQRERSSKSKKRPTQEDILADMVRVAEDEATNPWHEWRVISPRRYELYGHFPIEELYRLGSFGHVAGQAGLRMRAGDRTLLRARTAQSLQDHDTRYMRRFFLPHVQKFPELRRRAKKWNNAVVISDLHGLTLDPFTWDTAVTTAVHLGSDVFYLNGDVIDGGEISTHPKIPGSRVPLQLEFDFVRALLREAKEKLPPHCRIVWGAGNHFLDRVVRYLTQQSGLASLRSNRIDQMVDLAGLDIELVQGGTFVSPAGTEDDAPRSILWDSYMVTHGTRLGKFPAAAELGQWGMSGTSGHVHRSSMHFGATFKDRGLSWLSTPMACVEDAGRDYIKDFAGWQKGFGVAYVSPKGNVRQFPVVTDGGEAYCEGIVHTRDPRLPQLRKPLKKYWIDRLGLDLSDYV